MFANYLKITLRNLLGNKLYSAINLLGLAVGLASTLLIGLFVLDELSYDKQWQDADRIYRISSDFPHQGIFMAANAPQTAPLLKLDFPEIEHAARLFGGQALLRNGETAFYESNIRFADNEFFDIFKLQWLAGDPAQALAKPFTIVLTESIAKKYFGNEPALGKTLLLENKAPMLVTGVIRDLPHNTHLDLSVIGSLESLRNIAGPQFFENWGSNNFHTYVKLKPGVNIATVTQRFDEFLNKHINPNATTIRGMTATAIGDIHLHSNRQFEMTPPGSMSTVYTFGAAALFILMIACFNFMNLATARSTRRGQEVGIRKTLGASRSEIARQFVGESVLLTLLAAVLGLVLVELVLPYFNALLGKSLDLKVLLDGRVFALLAAAVVIVGLFAGSYPAFFLSAFKPVQVLRSVLASTGSLAFRNTLVILQFAIAIVLVVSSLVVILQMRHARSIELGFQKDQILIMAGSPTAGMGPQWDAMRQALLRLPGVEAVSASSQTPLVNNTNSMGLRPQGQQDMSLLPFLYIDYDFFRAYRVPVLAGREFDEDHPGDRLLQSGKHDDTHKAGVILNQLAAAQLGWTPDQAVGQEVQISMSEKGDPAIVVGVVANSLFESAHNAL
ncbi:MAG TPA: ABC transporter permease, partial [Candidatus Acidoferrum sp.]|nr:ABC transporter permease [Candidatus Acidoferrum sp.]